MADTDLTQIVPSIQKEWIVRNCRSRLHGMSSGKVFSGRLFNFVVVLCSIDGAEEQLQVGARKSRV